MTERQYCLFGIWSGETKPVHVIKIMRDCAFWETKMEPKIIRFYNECLLPEIIDPRNNRGMEIRKIKLMNEKENVPPEKISVVTHRPLPETTCPIEDPVSQLQIMFSDY